MHQTSFDWHARTRILFGRGQIDRTGEITFSPGVHHALLVTDAGIVGAGHAARAQRSLEKAGLRVTVFDRVRENPTTKCVDDCVSVAKSAGIDALIGLGGGSSMDTAKGCNFILTNGGRMQDYWGVGKAMKPMLPFIAIPTTAGTGSECQSAALIADEVTHQKMACLDPKCAARVAILDPELTISQPPRVTACTGIDAVAHAVETAVTKKRTVLSQMFSREAFRLCAGAFPIVITNPDDLEARGRMLLGAAMAGMAIENSMLGAAHSAANPLTAHCGIAHGQAVGAMLPHVVRFNGNDSQARKLYAELAVFAGIAFRDDNEQIATEKLAAQLETMNRMAGLGSSLAALGVSEKLIPALAEEAGKQWTATFNPRPVTAADFAKLYGTAMG